VINRNPYNGSLILGETYWLTAVTDILEQKPVVDFEMNTTYTSGSRNLEVKIDLIFLEAMNAELMLSVYFVEDSIISWQKDYSLEVGEQDVEFYVHNHVLRDAINGTWGDVILTGQAEANMVKSKSYQYSINPEWKVKNSSIVAFVYKNDTKEVLQASQENIIQ